MSLPLTPMTKEVTPSTTHRPVQGLWFRGLMLGYCLRVKPFPEPQVKCKSHRRETWEEQRACGDRVCGTPPAMCQKEQWHQKRTLTSSVQEWRDLGGAQSRDSQEHFSLTETCVFLLGSTTCRTQWPRCEGTAILSFTVTSLDKSTENKKNQEMRT